MNTKFIVDLLYAFKKDYGSCINYIVIDGSEFQVDTGVRSFIKRAYKIQCVVLPKQVTRKFIQDIGYLAANKNFTYGALNDYNEVKIIIDANDLPKDLDINLNGYFVYNDKRYEKTKFDVLEHRLAYFLTGKGAEGGKPYDIMKFRVPSNFQLQQGVSFELN